MALNGTEIVYVQGVAETGNPGAIQFPTTTLEIAALADAANVPPVINTPISTVGNGTLTAAGIVGGLITRSGPVAAFSDATDTAVAIVAALSAYVANESAYLIIKNTTAFAQTITAGSGVTLSGSVIIPANSVGTYLVTITSPTAVTMLHVETGPRTTKTPEVSTTLATNGDGTITGAGIAGGVTNRTTVAVPFTDTTDTADNIIAAQPNVHIGDSWEYTYKNNSTSNATITGGSGVTVSGVVSVPATGSVRYLVTYTAASTITMFGFQNTGTASSIKRCTTQTDTITATLANITGLTGFNLTAGATYRFRCVLPGTADGTSGISVAFKYTTATLTSIESTALSWAGTTLSANKHVTSTTDQALLVDVAAAVTLSTIEGTMVVNAGGTVSVQVATHTGTTTASIYAGASAEFTRIA